MRAFSYAWSLPLTWQRWRSHHSIRPIRIPHAARKRHSSMFYRSGVIADRSFTLWEWDFGPFFVPVTWTLTGWFLYMNLTRTPGLDLRGCAKMNFLRQSLQKLSHDRLTYRQTLPKLYTTPLRGWSVIKYLHGLWPTVNLLAIASTNNCITCSE